MSQITVSSYRIGPQEWQKGSDGWYVQMWGWWPGNTGSPSWRWAKVDDEKVPAELKQRWSRDQEGA